LLKEVIFTKQQSFHMRNILVKLPQIFNRPLRTARLDPCHRFVSVLTPSDRSPVLRIKECIAGLDQVDNESEVTLGGRRGSQPLYGQPLR
jgi:hypothetical protein